LAGKCRFTALIGCSSALERGLEGRSVVTSTLPAEYLDPATWPEVVVTDTVRARITDPPWVSRVGPQIPCTGRARTGAAPAGPPGRLVDSWDVQRCGVLQRLLLANSGGRGAERCRRATNSCSGSKLFQRADFRTFHARADSDETVSRGGRWPDCSRLDSGVIA
jgi:hypothetical protein